MSNTKWLSAISLFALFFTIALIQWSSSQEDVIRFCNVREALVGGHIAIATNQNDTLRKIADAVSEQLSQLGIVHLGSKGYTKHLAAEMRDPFYRVSTDAVFMERVPEKCKLILIIVAQSVEGTTGNVASIRYCLIDRSGKGVIYLESSSDWNWPEVDCKGVTAEYVAEQIVGGLFDELHLNIWATTAPSR